MNNNNTQQATFWKFLSERKIEIPKIQRDYAQGRIGKEKLRERFLNDLKNALDGKLPNNEEKLKLDFVYGSIENEKLYPLDGQQRLTTLWLLHWFIAYKAGVLPENQNIFKQFTYETRVSSREFCKKLSEIPEQTDRKIVEHIQNQTCFFSAWKQDPTIQAMLNMLGGTDIKNKEGDIIDGIEELFDDKCNFKDYWEKLTETNDKKCPIIFYYMPLNDLKLTDDLYIKMNARGKPLTSFENFKADLVDYMKKKIENNEWKQYKVEFEGKEIDWTTCFEIKLDTDWTNIFWKNRSLEYNIDDIYFVFFNRYFLNALITAKNNDGKYIFTGKDWEKDNDTFKYLIGPKVENETDDTKIEYHNFDPYSPIEDKEEVFSFETYKRLSKILDNFHSVFKIKEKKEENHLENIRKSFLPSWDKESNFRFIPEYKDNPKYKENHSSEPKYIPTILTQQQRVVFFAICRYFENINSDSYCEQKLGQWIRVVWNIVENAGIDGVTPMIGTMRLIDDLANYANDIYAHLKNRNVEKDAAKEQMKEEKEKAKLIDENKDYRDPDGKSWEEKIIEAEKTAFFKGAIRFMFTDENGDYDWNLFDDRYKKSQTYFDENGVAENYKKGSILLRLLISNFIKLEHFQKLDYDNNASTWKQILLYYRKTLASFFNANNIETIDFNTFNSPIEDSKLRFFHNDLCKTSILNHISSLSYLHFNHDKYSLFPYNTKSKSKIFVLADKRNEILSKLIDDKVIIDSKKQKLENVPYFWGWDIAFEHCNKEWYKWTVGNCLKKWNIDTQQYDEEPIKDKDGNNITIDTLDTYLRNL